MSGKVSPQDSVTRRFLVRQLLDLPVTWVGIVTWVGVGSTLTSCGGSRVSGQEADQSQETPRKNPARRETGSRKSAVSGASKSLGAATEGDQDVRQGAGSASPLDGSPQASSDSAPSKPKLSTNVRGARPNGGFFSNGAPTLTKEQIEAGEPIEGTCEGTNHKLVITAEHLAELAQGRSVRVQSATNSHFLNPTVHRHTVTYTPMT